MSPKAIRMPMKDKGTVSYLTGNCLLLSEGSRVIKYKKLLRWIKSNPSAVKIFSDKNLRTMNQLRYAF